MSAPDFPIVGEMARFASFAEATKGYISHALAIGLRHPEQKVDLGSFPVAAAMTLARMDVYSSVPVVRDRIATKGFNLETWSAEFGLLHRYAQFDVRYEEMSDFGAFVFLYERLLGPAVRPWLLSIYLAAAASPLIDEKGREERLSRLTAYDVAHDFAHEPSPEYFPGLE